MMASDSDRHGDPGRAWAKVSLAGTIIGFPVRPAQSGFDFSAPAGRAAGPGCRAAVGAYSVIITMFHISAYGSRT